MSYELRNYQKEAVSTALNRFENYRSPFILSLSVAAGKSLIIADICHKLDEPVLILQPSRELILQNYEKLKSYGVDDISMYSASVNSKEIAKYTYATIQSVYKKPELFKHFKYVLIDECFVAGTLVDGKPIEDYKVGDTVSSYNHTTGNIENKLVTRVIKKPSPNKLYCIKSQDRTIIVTPNHEIYTNNGYVRADKLNIGDVIYEKKIRLQQPEMRPVQKEDTGCYKIPQDNVFKDSEKIWYKWGKSILCGWRMWDEVYKRLCKVSISSQQNKRGYSQATGNKKGERHKAYLGYKPRAAWWKWENICTTIKTARSSRKRMDHGATCKDGTKKPLPNVLQDGYREPVLQTSNRSRWALSYFKRSDQKRQEEGEYVAESRVESIEIYEQGSYGKLGLSDGGDYVYCISVEDNRNFFANDLLVHNCDLLNMEQKSSMYHKFFKGLGDIKVCGLTATPYRAKRYATIDKIGNMSYATEFKLLNRFWPMYFKEIAYSKDIGELQEEGYVSRAEYYTQEDDDWDLLKVNSTGADFTEESLEHFADRKVRQMMEILPTLIKHKKVLFFCSSIRQATMVSNALSSAKITCPLITANTPKKERAQIVEDYKSGKIRFLANVSTLLAGFDVPDIDAIVMMRPTLSIRVLYQSLGRGLRLDPNDPNKVLSVYDLAGVTLRFGRVETLKIGYEDPEAALYGRFSPNILLSEVGRLDNVVLSSFRIKNEKMKNRLRGIAKRI
jgi:superfamily II DNA or RNA helicase